jgi:hypothetical protein
MKITSRPAAGYLAAAPLVHLLVSIAAISPAVAAPLVIGAGDTIELAAGTHSFESIIIHPAGTLKLLGNVVLNVAGDVLLLRETDPGNPYYYRNASILAEAIHGANAPPFGDPHGQDGNSGQDRPRVTINSGGSIFAHGTLVGVGGPGNLDFVSGDGGNGGMGMINPHDVTQAGHGGNGGFAGSFRPTASFVAQPDVVVNAAQSIVFDGRSFIRMSGGTGGHGGDGGNERDFQFDPAAGGHGGDGGHGGNGANIYLQAREIQLDGSFIDLAGGRGGNAGYGGSTQSIMPGGNGGDGGRGGYGGLFVMRGFDLTNTMDFYAPGGEGGSAGYGGDSGDGIYGTDGQDGLGGLDGVLVIRRITDQPGLSNGDFSEGLAFYRQSGQGSATIVELDENPFLEMSAGITENVALNLSQLVSTDTDLPFLVFEFDYRFLTDVGTLEVLLDETVLVSLPAVQSSDFIRYSVLLDDPAIMGVEVAELYLRLHPGSVATVQLDNLLFQPPLPGDANLDGRVDIADLGILAANWQQTADWFGGDFTSDGVVDIADLGILAANWQAGVESGGMSFEAGLAMFDVYDGVVVPEPGVAGLLLGFGVPGLRRRRQPMACSTARVLSPMSRWGRRRSHEPPD